jgi:hypothetical protein
MMMPQPFRRLTVQVLPGLFAASKLAAGEPIPGWAIDGPFTSVTRTSDELSIVCPEENVPSNVASEQGLRCLRIAGTLEFSMVGILASLLEPLAQAGIAVFVVSTFDTDFLLVKARDLERAAFALERAGHAISLGAVDNNE